MPTLGQGTDAALHGHHQQPSQSPGLTVDVILHGMPISLPLLDRHKHLGRMCEWRDVLGAASRAVGSVRQTAALEAQPSTSRHRHILPESLCMSSTCVGTITTGAIFSAATSLVRRRA